MARDTSKDVTHQQSMSKLSEKSKQTSASLLNSTKATPKALADSGEMDGVLGQIYQLMVDNRKDELAQRVIEEKYKKTDTGKEEQRHQELLKALTVRRRPKPKRVIRREKKAEEKEAAKPTEPAKPTAPAKKPAETAKKPPEPAKKPPEPAKKPPEPAKKPAEPAKKPAEDTAKKAAEDKAKKAAEDKAKKESEDRAKKAAEDKAKKEADDKAKKTAEQVKPPEVKPPKAEPVKPPDVKPPKSEPAPAARPPPTTTKPSTAGKIAAGVAASGAFAGLTFTERAQAASQGFKKLGLTNDVAIAGVLSTSAKETQIGAAGTESGADSYKKTFDRLEAGRGAIPDSLKAKGVKQLGPGVGVQYLNLTFGKKDWTKEKWESAFAKGEDGFFKDVGYKGGSKYKGRGLIQVTHEAGYKHIGNLLGLDLLKNPELVANDRNINIAASLGYMGLSVGGFGFPPTDVKESKLKEFYQKGLDRLNGIKDFKEALNVSASNVFSGGRGMDYQKLENNESYKTNLDKAQKASGDVLSALSTENADLKEKLNKDKSTQTTNNTTTTNNQTNNVKPEQRVDDRPPHVRKQQQ